MKLFECIIDDGKEVFKTLTASKNKKELLNVYGGNGGFEKIKDVTNNYLNESSLEKLENDLSRMQWGEGEKRLILALVEEHLTNRK